MARRRSNPPRGRKGRNADSVAPPQSDVAVVVVDPTDSVTVLADLAHETTPAPPMDEMAALDAGWDDIGS